MRGHDSAALSGIDLEWLNGISLRQGSDLDCCGAVKKRKWTMKAGVVYPQIELGGDIGAVKAFAQAAEELGYDHIVIYDHVLGAVHAGREPQLTGPYKETDPFHEPLVTYAYLAGITKKLELVTGVIILPQRQTALFAKQAADVDLFSEGRLRLGVGIGWNWVEYDALEMPRHFRRRGRRQEQQIGLIRKLWEEPIVQYQDSDHRIDRAGIPTSASLASIFALIWTASVWARPPNRNPSPILAARSNAASL
jgi:alkanesulfonate monooxygenase SsuD/methylene tetrahydromethanopterin reductase-like flavin-dependent oxidoreductase (luciferase family)